MKLVDDHLPGAASSSSGPKNGTQPSTQVTPEARVALGDVAYRVMVTYGCTAIVSYTQPIYIYIYTYIYDSCGAHFSALYPNWFSWL